MDMESSTVCVQLLRLCVQVDEVRLRVSGELQGPQLVELIGRIRDLASASSRAGRSAYGSLCLHLAERIEDLSEYGRMPRTALLWLDLWADRSLRYLSEPGAVSAAALLEQLNDPLWCSPFSHAEQNLLLRALIPADDCPM